MNTNLRFEELERRVSNLGDTVTDILDSLMRNRAAENSGKIMLTTMQTNFDDYKNQTSQTSPPAVDEQESVQTLKLQ